MYLIYPRVLKKAAYSAQPGKGSFDISVLLPQQNSFIDLILNIY